MSEKINIAELLENCPKGMELYSPIFGKVYLDKVRPNLGVVVTTDKSQSKEKFLYDGRYGMNGECMLFPSKDKTTWEGFQRPFMDGDVLFVDCSDEEEDKMYQYIFILNNPELYGKWYSYCHLYGAGCFYSEETYLADDEYHPRFATEEEKKKLFDAIKKHGYKWNADSKTLEELPKPKFKVDDKIKRKGGDEIGYITQVTDCCFTIKCKNNTHCWPIERQDAWELVPDIKPKFKVGNKVRNNHNVVFTISSIEKDSYVCGGKMAFCFNEQDDYELVPNKFDITTLKPFESRVLVRHNKYNKWCGSFFSHIDGDFHSHCYKYVTIAGKSYPMCIPYEGNEHLLGTTNECDEYYKNWKE